MAFSAYSTGLSPVTTDIFGEYNENRGLRSIKEIFLKDNVAYFLEEYKNYGSISENSILEDREEFILELKKHLMEYGALYVSTVSPSIASGCSCVYKDTTHDNYLINITDDSCNCTAHHAMAIIGWDDDYEYQYCRLKGKTSEDLTDCDNIVKGKGAFILKNSWGKTTQYPYIAYTSIMNDVSGVSLISEKNWINQYDKSKNYSSSWKNKMATVTYKTDSGLKEQIEIIRFNVGIASVGSIYEVLLDVDGSGNYIEIDEVYIDSAGGYTVDVGRVPITSDSFTIKLNYESGVPTEIYAFTTYYEEENDVRAYSILASSDEYNEYSSSIDLYTNTKNIPTGDMLEYKLFDEDGKDITSLIEVKNNFVLNNIVESNITVLDKIRANKVTLQTLYNGQVMDSLEFFVMHAVSYWKEGNGSVTDPYMIYNLEDFKNIFKDKINLGANYKLGSDINFGKGTWSARTQTFSGSFDGDGHSIYGVRCDLNAVCSLFYKIEEATIKNLVITDFYASNTLEWSSALVGMATDSVIENIVVTREVTIISTKPHTGGIIGKATDSKLIGIANYGTYRNLSTLTNNYLGGIVNQCLGCEISESYNYGFVTSEYGIAGGIAGRLIASSLSSNYAIIENSFNAGNVGGG